MAVSKVILNGQTLIDVTEDTVASNNLLQGNQATGADGQKVSGAYVAPTFSTQSKTATPSETSQSILPDAGYDALSQVTVNAISSTYIGSGVTKKAAQTYTPGTTDQTIAAGQYLDGVQTIKGDANLVPSNIASGVSIFGVQGTHEGGGGTDVDERFVAIVERRPISQLTLNGISTIGSYAFYLWSTPTNVIASECIAIEERAFAYCSSLSTIHLSQCSNIGIYAFAGDRNLEDVIFEECLTVQNGAFQACATSASNATAIFPKCTNIGSYAFERAGFVSVSFPECTAINASAFNSASKLITAYFPNCLSIGPYAFMGCSQLTTVDFPNCVSIASSNTFANCYALNSVTLPKCEEIPRNCFSNCSSLSSINLSACKIVQQAAFVNCVSLEYISLPNCLSIGLYVFSNCSMLNEITLPKCSSIGNYAFASCYRLSKVNADACKYLGSAAFMNCSSLEVISLPAVVSLYSSTFSGCSNLKSVYFLGSSVVRINATGALPPADTQETYYYVPASLYSTYLSANGWSTALSSRLVSVQS